MVVASFRPYSEAFKQKMVQRLTGKGAVSALRLGPLPCAAFFSAHQGRVTHFLPRTESADVAARPGNNYLDTHRLRHREQPRVERVVQGLQGFLFQVDVAEIVVHEADN